jgi:hypothetical protein
MALTSRSLQIQYVMYISEGDASGGASAVRSTKSVRALKVVRLIRMSKMLRVAKVKKLIDKYKEHFLGSSWLAVRQLPA